MRKQRAYLGSLLLTSFLLVSLIASAGCAGMAPAIETALELNPERTLRAALARSPAEWKPALAQAQEVHKQLSRQAPLEGHSPLQERLQRVAERLVAVSHYPALPVKVYFVRDGSLNAFNTGAGYLYVHTGLVRRAGSEDELAFVLGHELAHAMANHVHRKILPRLLLGAGTALASLAVKGKSAEQLITAVHQYLSTGYSRRHEREADVLGAFYALKAGYDPLRGAEFFVKAARVEQQLLQDLEHKVRAAYDTYAMAQRQCAQATQLYQTYARTTYGPHYYRQAQADCQRANVAAQGYEEVAERYKATAARHSPLFRDHPVNEERIRTLNEVVSALRDKAQAVHFSTAEAEYTLRVVSSPPIARTGGGTGFLRRTDVTEIAEIAARAGREAVQTGRPVYYESTDGFLRVEAEPITSTEPKCKRVRERIYEQGQLMSEQIREICEE